MPYRPAEKRLVACVWMPGFEIQVERWRCPELAGVPLVLLRPGAQPAVMTCSPEARDAGIREGMSLRAAMATASHAVFQVADPHFYAEIFSRAASDLEQVSPTIEIAAPGRAFLCLEGLISGDGAAGLRNDPGSRSGIYRTPRGLALALERAVPSPWAARLGIGLGKFAAWAAARVSSQLAADAGLLLSASGRTRWLPENRQTEFLKPLSIQLLPVSPEMRRKLWTFGLRTLGQLTALPLTAVVAQFGKEGRRAWLLSSGCDEDPIRPREVPVEVVETLQLSSPETTLEALVVASQRLLERALKRPEAQWRGVRQVRLDAALESGRVWTRSITFRQPGTLFSRLAPLIRYYLERDHPTEAVRSLSLALTAFTSCVGGQGALFREPQQERNDRLVEALRQIRTQMGRVPVARIVEVEPWSRMPERRYHLLSYDP